MSLVEKLFGSFSDRELKKINPIAKQVLALEGKYAALSDAELQAQTAAFKQQLADGKTTDDILPDAFAVCREAAWRVLGMKHFPVQIIGGIALHRGDISEMQTGEGKTLVATLPAYLNALTGEGVHVVTVNDYLAKRDSEWMGKLYRWLGLSTSVDRTCALLTIENSTSTNNDIRALLYHRCDRICSSCCTEGNLSHRKMTSLERLCERNGILHVIDNYDWTNLNLGKLLHEIFLCHIKSPLNIIKPEYIRPCKRLQFLLYMIYFSHTRDNASLSRLFYVPPCITSLIQ